MITANNGDAQYTQVAELELLDSWGKALTVNGTATADRTDNRPGEDNRAGKAFDGNGYSCWHTNEKTGTLTYTFEQGTRVVNHYTVMSSNKAEEAPVSWRLEGSNGSTWETLDSRTNQKFSKGYEKKEYGLINTTGYRSYRLVMTGTASTGVSVSEITLDSDTGERLDYYYDESGNLFGFRYNGAEYYYERNGQSDIEGILDSTGTRVISYEYDSWGKLLAVKDGAGTDVSNNPNHIGNVNPFRYRGYFYDTESGLYYLQSRYYDPVVGRFINADGYVTTGQGLLGNNMFAYCLNNPLNMADTEGNFAWVVAGVTMMVLAAMGTNTAAAIAQEMSKGIGNLFDRALQNSGGTTVLENQVAIRNTPLLVTDSDLNRSKAKEKDITSSTKKSKPQAIFTLDPHDFNPKGLVMKEYPGTKNGRIIEWRDPISQAKIFEWDEDLNKGPHYHTMMIEWDGNHRGVHYLPGTPVPEPWNSFYFGG